MSIVVCGGTFRYGRRFGDCWGACSIPDSALAMSLSPSPWYGHIVTCTNCGDRWGLGEGMFGRPFERGWRQKRIDSALAEWDAACDCPEELDDDHYLLPCEHQKATA
jgi:hypothetical protein